MTVRDTWEAPPVLARQEGPDFVLQEEVTSSAWMASDTTVDLGEWR
jgi:hypothetical protein